MEKMGMAADGCKLEKERVISGGIGVVGGSDLVVEMLELWMGGKEQGSVSGFCGRHCWMGCE